MRARVFLLLFFAPFIAAFVASANVQASEWTAHSVPVASVVSGTLVPLTVAIDGKPILDKKESASSININGSTAVVNLGENHPFFLLVTSSRIRIQVHLDGSTLVLPEIRMPELEAVSIDPTSGALSLESDEPVAWKIDGLSVPATSKWVQWRPSNELWFQATHTVELSSAGKTRSYNLTFERTPPLSRAHRILTAAGVSNRGEPDLLLEYAYRTASSWQWGIGFSYQSDPTLNTEGLQIELQHSILGRLNFGVFARSFLLGGSVISSDGDSTVTPPPGVQAGPLLQYDIWNHGVFGAFLRVQEAIRLSGDNPSCAQAGAGIQLAF